MPSHAMAAAPLPDELDVLVVGAGPAGGGGGAPPAGGRPGGVGGGARAARGGPGGNPPPRAPGAVFRLWGGGGVVGAGPAGAAVAAQLAGHCRVALVGRAVQAGRAIGETLPAAARVILSDLGVWDAFAAQGHRPAWSRRSLWGSSEVIFQDALFDPHSAVWHLDRQP